MSYLVCIAGSSGVGKTTIANVMSALYGSSSTVVLSGDDLHYWPRGHKNWDIFTHLHPDANNLNLGREHIFDLKNGKNILRSKYNHHTGHFDKEQIIQPLKCTIYEGLHALYDEKIRNISDLNLYVDTDEDLKCEWKIKRDITSRGYTIEQVENTIRRRKSDEDLYIIPQKKWADIVVRFSKCINKVFVNFVALTKRGQDVLPWLSANYRGLEQFVYLAKELSESYELCQSKGGNISVKTPFGMFVKSSGTKFSEITFQHGYSFCKLQESPQVFCSDFDYEQYLSNICIGGSSRPSMETGLHLARSERVVLHTHPLFLNAILCSTTSSEILQSLFYDIKFKYIPYTAPGKDLANIFSDLKLPPILFLENHGLVVSSSDVMSAFALTQEINIRCKNWIDSQKDNYVPLEIPIKDNRCLFPDAAILPEMMEVNAHIHNLINAASLVPRWLSELQVNYIKNMNLEKFRQYES